MNSIEQPHKQLNWLYALRHKARNKLKLICALEYPDTHGKVGFASPIEAATSLEANSSACS